LTAEFGVQLLLFAGDVFGFGRGRHGFRLSSGLSLPHWFQL
jgi:hypothetical protein